jgi:hypothetical protein
VIKLFQDEAIYKTFKEKLTRAQALFEVIAPDPSLSKYLWDYRWFNQVNEIFNKHLRSGKESLKPYMEKTALLIKGSVVLKEIDKSLPTFEIDANYLDKINKANYDTYYEVAELRQAVKHYIRINIDLNPVLESLSERLDRIVKGKDPEQVKIGLRELITEINRMEAELVEKGITREEHALIVVVQKQVTSVPESELIPFVKMLSKKLDQTPLLFKGWHTKSETRKEVQRLIFGDCFGFFRDRVEPAKILDLTDGMMEYVTRFRS